jgi:hypothetical protein
MYIIAFYNLNDKTLFVERCETKGEMATGIENYYRELMDETMDDGERVYILKDFDYVDTGELADWEDEDFVANGWEVL